MEEALARPDRPAQTRSTSYFHIGISLAALGQMDEAAASYAAGAARRGSNPHDRAGCLVDLGHLHALYLELVQARECWSKAIESGWVPAAQRCQATNNRAIFADSLYTAVRDLLDALVPWRSNAPPTPP